MITNNTIINKPLELYLHMNSLEDNALYQIKQLAGNDPSSMREMAGRVFDKKLKSFLSLNSKQ